MISIRIQNLVKRYGEIRALDDVSLEIEAGEIFFLLGPSGCGKTTLLRTVAGFSVPDDGTIHFGEDDVTQLAPHRRNTGMMFQSYALWPHKTVAGNVAFGLEERRVPKVEARKRVEEALASVRMEKYGDRKIHQLSGGQQQRVALARALVIRPRCLLLDEPLSNLDAKLRLEMRGEIRRICKESGLTVLYVTHDQKEALSVADRLAVLEGGCVRQVGSPAEVYRRPQTRFVADFIGETNVLKGTVSAPVGGEVLAVATSLGELVGYRCSEEFQPKVGASVLVSVRPESWQLRVEPGDENSVRGRIHNTIYLGEMAQYDFGTDGAVLSIYEMNPRFTEGTRMREFHAVARREDVVVLPVEGTG